MREIPLDVLGYEGPVLRAYLGVLRLCGIRPRRLVMMIGKRDASGKPRLPAWMPSFCSRVLNRIKQDADNNHWVRWLARRHGERARQSLDVVIRAFGFPGEVNAGILDDLTSLAPHGRRYGIPVTEVEIDHLKDARLTSALNGISPTCILFSGGGIVPQELLELEGIRLLHIHPGYLPEVRGADGLLWSVLVRRSIGASAFYMTRKIDEGDVICRREFDCPALPGLPDLDDANLYRWIYAFVDPLLRARLLLEVVKMAADRSFMDLPVTPQDIKAGRTYHFMHPRLRRRAFRNIYSSPSPSAPK